MLGDELPLGRDTKPFELGVVADGLPAGEIRSRTRDLPLAQVSECGVVGC